jgi:hypothetical protein
MGLDQYLYAKKYMSFPSWMKESKFGLEKQKEVSNILEIRRIFPEIYESGNINSITVKFEVGYWRKVNAIHGWFVDHCQDGIDDCRDAYVSRENLKELLLICERIVSQKNKKRKVELAKELLPSEDGCCFGDKEYDTWYFEGLKNTVKIITKALTLPDCWEFEYGSSW